MEEVICLHKQRHIVKWMSAMGGTQINLMQKKTYYSSKILPNRPTSHSAGLFVFLSVSLSFLYLSPLRSSLSPCSFSPLSLNLSLSLCPLYFSLSFHSLSSLPVPLSLCLSHSVISFFFCHFSLSLFSFLIRMWKERKVRHRKCQQWSHKKAADPFPRWSRALTVCLWLEPAARGRPAWSAFAGGCRAGCLLGGLAHRRLGPQNIADVHAELEHAQPFKAAVQHHSFLQQGCQPQDIYTRWRGCQPRDIYTQWRGCQPWDIYS